MGMETTTTYPAADPHAGRPVAPEHAERGAALMAQWATEDREAAIEELLRKGA